MTKTAQNLSGIGLDKALADKLGYDRIRRIDETGFQVPDDYGDTLIYWPAILWPYMQEEKINLNYYDGTWTATREAPTGLSKNLSATGSTALEALKRLVLQL